MTTQTLRKLVLISTLAVSGTVVGCSKDHKTQKQAATEQWNQTRATVLCSLAKDQYAAGNLDKCRETLNNAMPLDPTSVQLMLLSARVDIEQGRLESAQQQLAAAAKAAPNEAEIDYLTGVIQQRWQRLELASDAYARAVAKRPDDVAYLLAQAEMMVEMDRTGEALAMLKERVRYFEHSAAIRDAIGQLLEGTGDLSGATDYYRQATVLDTNDLAVRERLAMVLFQQGDFRDCLTQLNRVLREPTSANRSDLQLVAGECELNLNAPAEARRRFDAILDAEPTDALAWLCTAKASLALSDLRRADQAITRAASLPPTADLASTYAVMGYIRVRQGRFEEAVRCFRIATERDSRDAASMSMLGVSLSRLGRTDEARSCYQRALAIDPSDALANRLLMTQTASAND